MIFTALFIDYAKLPLQCYSCHSTTFTLPENPLRSREISLMAACSNGHQLSVRTADVTNAISKEEATRI